MAKRALPNLGLIGAHVLGEDDWGDDQNNNLLKLSVLVQGGIIGRVADLPADPKQGDVYVQTTDGKVQVRDGDLWFGYTPLEGWLLYDRGTDEYISYKPDGWEVLATGSSDGGGGGGDPVVLPGSRATPEEAAFNYPDLSTFAWLNQRGATAVSDVAGTAIASPQFVNGIYTQKLTAAPAGDFDVYARVSALFNTSGDYPAWAISLRASGAARGLHLGATPANNTVYLQDVNDDGGFNGNRFSRQFNRMPSWYRISRRGTVIVGYASINGIDWLKVGQYDAGALAIDQMGIGVIPSAPTDNAIRVLYFGTAIPAFGVGGTVPAVEYGGNDLAGWRKSADGWLEQWGTINGNTDVVFTIPYDAVFSLQGNMAGFLEGVNGYSAVFNYLDLTKLGFKARPRANNGSGTYTPGEQFRWRAVGRVAATGGGGGSPAKYRIGGFFVTTPAANEVILMHVATEDFGFPALLAGSRAKVSVNPTAETVFSIARNGVEIGKMTVAIDGTATFTGGNALISAGDLITVTAPAGSNGLANTAFTLKGV